jgi:hypothetical protein
MKNASIYGGASSAAHGEALTKLAARDEATLKLEELKRYSSRNRSGSSKSTVKAQAKSRAKAKAARKARK